MMTLLALLFLGCDPETADGYDEDPHVATVTPCQRVLQLDGEFDPEYNFWVVPFEEGLEHELTMTYVVDGEAVRLPGEDYRIEGAWLTSFEFAAERCELSQWEE